MIGIRRRQKGFGGQAPGVLMSGHDGSLGQRALPETCAARAAQHGPTLMNLFGSSLGIGIIFHNPERG